MLKYLREGYHIYTKDISWHNDALREKIKELEKEKINFVEVARLVPQKAISTS